MKGAFVSAKGIAYPSDLRVLKQVFDRVCRENHIEESTLGADDLAQAAMSLFRAGVLDETELTVSLHEFIKRKSPTKPT
jgi:hypothetical protein